MPTSIDYNALATSPRLLLECELKPLQGDRFQPTGFADLGPARYTRPDGTEMLLVESAQSVANRLEMTIWDEANDDLIPEMRGLPYIVVKDGEKNLTNSILEAHRINSEYIQKSGDDSLRSKFIAEIGHSKAAPIDRKRVYAALFKYDTGSLLHGCFLEEIDGRLRVTRAISGFVESERISEVASGGVKNNHVQPSLKRGEGNVPFSRMEFVADTTKAYFNLDLALLRGYGLGTDATNLLIALALFKVQRFLKTGLRLRTACDLEPTASGLKATRPNNLSIPDEAALLQECKALIAKCKAADLFAGGPTKSSVTEVEWVRPAGGGE